MKKSVLFLLFSLILLLFPSSALTISVTGGYVGEPVTVKLDKEAFVIFRMNNGTPVYAYGTQVKFLPHVTGKLYVEARAGDEVASKIVEIKIKTVPTPSTSTAAGSYSLPSGTVAVTLEGGGVEQVDYRTALGVLIRASEVKGFDVKIKKWSYGLFVDCIKGVCTKALGPTSGWMYTVNGEIASVSAEQYKLNPGDEVVWYFSRSMSETPETSPYKIEIVTFSDWTFDVNVYWKSESVSHEEYSTGGAPTPTPTPKPTPKVEKIVRLNATENRAIITPGEKVKVELKIPLEISIKSKKPVSVEVVQKKVGGVVFKDLPATVIEAFDLEVNESAETVINFSLSKDVLEKYNASPEDVYLAKHDGKWIYLPTEVVGENDTHIFFTAETTNFSLFAIAIKWKNFPLNASDEPIVKALNWLRTIQNGDGGFANPGEESSVAKTSWAIMAIVAAGEDPHAWKKNGKSPVDYIREHLKEELPKMGTADYARTILALVSAGEDPRSFAGVNLVEKLKEKMKDDGQIGDFIYTTIWGILALVSVGEDVNKSVEWLKAHQNDDGGFAWAVGEKSDYDDTAAAIQALIAAGEPRDSEVVKRALEYLRTGQNPDGGMRYFGSSASNSASDSWTIQALVSAGINPAEWKADEKSVVDHLLSLQTDEGYFKYTSYQTSNPGYMTVSAIMALLGKAQPIKVMERQEVVQEVATPKPTLTQTPTPMPTPTPTPVAAMQTPTPATTKSEERKGIPGFEAILVVLAILVVVRRR